MGNDGVICAADEHETLMVVMKQNIYLIGYGTVTKSFSLQPMVGSLGIIGAPRKDTRIIMDARD